MQKIKLLESISDLNIKIQTAIQSIPISKRYFIALSGGMDSVALLYFCLPYLKLHTDDIQVIHVNHDLSPNAEVWSEFCKKLCNQLDLLCHIEKVSVVSDGKGVEAAARKARYDVFSKHLINGGVLLQGHHLNDQAETVLMRVFKGLGPAAIKGIPRARPLSHGFLYRPWLELPRALIESSCKLADLNWVEDESNLDVRFDRNYVRHEVIPVLSKRRATILYDLGRAAKKSRESVEFIEEWCEANKNNFLSVSYSEYRAINLQEFTKYTAIQQRFILRFWFDLLGISHPSESSFQRIFDELILLKQDSQAEVCWNNCVLRVFDNALFCLPRLLKNSLELQNHAPKNILLGEIGACCALEFPVGRLSISVGKIVEVNSNFLDEKKAQSLGVYEVVCYVPESVNELNIRFREGGEKIYCHSKNSSSLKKLYQTKKVLPWVRDKLPLIYSKELLVCSLAGFVAGAYQLDQDKLNKLSATISTPLRRVYFRFELS